MIMLQLTVHHLFCKFHQHHKYLQPAAAGRRLALSRVLTVVFGVIQAGLAVAAARLSESVVDDALAIAGFVAGPLLGVFALGMFTRKTGSRDAVFGMCAGLAVLGFIKFGTNIAWPWYALIGSGTTFAAGWILSQIMPAITKAANEQH